MGGGKSGYYVLGGVADYSGEDGCCFWGSLFGRERDWCGGECLETWNLETKEDMLKS